MELIAKDCAPKVTQPKEGATYDKIWKKKQVAEVCFFSCRDEYLVENAGK